MQTFEPSTQLYILTIIPLLLPLLLILAFAVYFLFAYAVQRIAIKTHTSHSWWAYIPFLNTLLIIKVAGKSYWWFLLFFVPIINIIVSILIWMAVARRLHRPSWWGIVIFIPFIGLIFFLLMAFTDPKDKHGNDTPPSNPVTDYIRDARHHGMSDDEIVKSLHESGWTSEEIYGHL